MTSKQLREIENRYPHNFGAYAESVVAFDVIGKFVPHDSVPFDVDSDIPEIRASVKSPRFTLVSATLSRGETFEEKVNDYFERVASDLFVYVSKTLKAYYMNADEFRDFIETFCGLERESEKNGGGMKIRARSESKAMLRWLEARAAA